MSRLTALSFALVGALCAAPAPGADLPVAPAPRPRVAPFVVRTYKPVDPTGAKGSTVIAEYGLKARDLETIRKLPGVAAAVPARYFESEAQVPGRTAAVRTFGTVPDHPVALKLDKGRFLTDEDCANKEKVCVIGVSVVASMFAFDKDGPIGKTIVIRGTEFRVVGVFRTKAGDTDRTVCVPLTTMNARFGAVITTRAPGTRTSEKVELNEIVVRAADPAKLEAVVEAVREALKKDHPNRDWDIPPR